MRDRLSGWLTSLSAKYIALFVLLVVVPAAGISAYLLDSSYNDNKRALVAVQREKSSGLARAVQQTLDDQARHLAAVDPSGASQEELEARLLEIRAGDPDVVFVAYLDSHGRERANAGIAPTTALLRGALAAARSNGVFFSRIKSEADSGEQGVSGGFATIEIFAATNYGEGVVREVYSVSDAFQARIVGEHLGRAGYAYMISRSGLALAYPRPEVLRRSAAGRTPLASLPQVQAALASSSGSGSTIGKSFRGQKVLAAWTTVDPVGWKVFVEQPESAAFAPLRGKIWRTAFLLAAFVGAAILLSILLARRLVTPIRRMRHAAARIGAGAYDERIELRSPQKGLVQRQAPDYPWSREAPLVEQTAAAESVVLEQPLPERRRQDDLGALAEDLNRMAADLQASRTQLERKVEERTRELQATLEELAEKSRELEVASEHKSEFLANMSHEVRTPLNAIVGFSQVLREKLFGELNDKQEEYLDDILSSANHLLSLINDILDLSKVEAGQVELELGTFSLREAVEGGIVMVRERASENGVSLELTLDPSIDLVEGDERRIRQVIFNLLSNAVKFTPDGGRVDVSAAQANGELRVAVTDTGPGIADTDQERIFEEFQQAKIVEGERPEGTGLGLALSKRLIELHGGRIWVESVPGQGSTFVFTLPVESR